MCHMSLKLAVSRNRPPVPYGANLFSFMILYLAFLVQYWLVTDGQTRDNIIYRASIVLHSKYWMSFEFQKVRLVVC